MAHANDFSHRGKPVALPPSYISTTQKPPLYRIVYSGSARRLILTRMCLNKFVGTEGIKSETSKYAGTSNSFAAPWLVPLSRQKQWVFAVSGALIALSASLRGGWRTRCHARCSGGCKTRICCISMTLHCFPCRCPTNEALATLWQVAQCQRILAEREGFEPPVAFRPQRFSRPPVSTAHAPLRGPANSLAIQRRETNWQRVDAPAR